MFNSGPVCMQFCMCFEPVLNSTSGIIMYSPDGPIITSDQESVADLGLRAWITDTMRAPQDNWNWNG